MRSGGAEDGPRRVKQCEARAGSTPRGRGEPGAEGTEGPEGEPPPARPSEEGHPGEKWAVPGDEGEKDQKQPVTIPPTSPERGGKGRTS